MVAFKRCVASLRSLVPQGLPDTRAIHATWWLPAVAGGTVLAGLALKPHGETQGRPALLRGRSVPEMVIRSDAADWQRFQRFSFARDDPYKINEAPDAAPFLQNSTGGARVQRGAVQISKLPVQGLETERDLYKGASDRTFAWQLDGVFTRDQCLELIDMANRKGFVPALTNNQNKYEVGDLRKGDELEFDFERRAAYIAMFDAPLLAEFLFDVLEPQLRVAPLPDGWRVDHLNSFTRVVCYKKDGQGHPPHYDGQLRYPKGKYPTDHEWAKARSLVTLMVYLSDVPSESGGSLAFPRPLAELTDADVRIQPGTGRAIIFSQNLWHAGAPMIEEHGDVKYVIRTDVMCLPKAEPQPHDA